MHQLFPMAILFQRSVTLLFLIKLQNSTSAFHSVTPSAMTIANTATARSKKLIKLTLALLCLGFNSSKCKTAAKMAVARIKLLRNKREAVVRQMRRDIALLLQSGQDATARIRVEHVMREQNVLAANEFIELFCELIVARLSIIAKQRGCPADLKEGIASLIFAAPRCSEIPELLALKDIFEKKYGKDFVSAATDLRPNCGVNRQLIEKLSVRTPPGEIKLKVMKEIAKEYQVEWDTAESEKELLKPPEELIEGPRNFISASSLPVKPSTAQSMETNRSGVGGEKHDMHYEDSVSAAEAAAESAKKAIAAAEVAAYLAKRESDHGILQPSVYVDKLNNLGINSGLFQSNDPAKNIQNMDHQIKTQGAMHMSQNLPRSDYIKNEDTIPTDMRNGEDYRRHSYNPTSAHSDIKFDESDCDEEMEMEGPPVVLPPQRPPPPIPSSQARRNSDIGVHPKLPDYDDLAARFEALKSKKSQS